MRSETEARPTARRRHRRSAWRRRPCPGATWVVCECRNDVIPSDGEITEGVASVDESAITGRVCACHPLAIRRGPLGGDWWDRGCSLTASWCASRRSCGKTFLDRMITLVEGANRQKTPNEIALTILLSVLTIVFLPVVVVLQPFGHYAGATVSVVVLVALLVCLIPTTIGALLSAIGIAGMDRLVQRNVLAMSGRAVEAAGDVQTLLLDKTGTITLGNRMASAFYPASGHGEEELAEAAQLASLADETPEGRSIVVLAKERFNIRERDLGVDHTFVPFSATTRMSGLDSGGHQIRKGAADAVKRWVTDRGGSGADRPRRHGGSHLAVRVHPVGGGQRRRHPRRDRAQGRGEAGHPREVRRDAAYGNPHDHDHRRQPSRPPPSPRRRASTTSWRKRHRRRRWPSSSRSRRAASSSP